VIFIPHFQPDSLKKDFSQKTFADHCGLHRTYMGGIERGERNLTIQTVLTLGRGLGLTMSELFSGIEKQAESPKPKPRAER
jgi:transcriptional regulator with XRE-family HTH domain